jgi:hypothetical protein
LPAGEAPGVVCAIASSSDVVTAAMPDDRDRGQVRGRTHYGITLDKPAQVDAVNDRNRRIVLKNSIFRVDHNLEDH